MSESSPAVNYQCAVEIGQVPEHHHYDDSTSEEGLQSMQRNWFVVRTSVSSTQEGCRKVQRRRSSLLDSRHNVIDDRMDSKVDKRKANESCSNLAIRPLSTHAFVPRLTLRCGRDITSPDHKIAKTFSIESLESVPLDHRPEDG